MVPNLERVDYVNDEDGPWHGRVSPEISVTKPH